MIKIILGLITVPLGMLLWGWILYNLLVQRMTEFKGSPIPAMLFGSALITVGGKWIKDGWEALQDENAERPVKKKKKVVKKAKRRPLKPLEPLDD